MVVPENISSSEVKIELNLLAQLLTPYIFTELPMVTIQQSEVTKGFSSTN